MGCCVEASFVSMSVRMAGDMPFLAHAASERAAIAIASLLILHQHFLRALLDDVDLDAAIRFASHVALVVGDRAIGTKALRLHPRRLDAFAREIFRDGLRALLRQL